MYLFVFLALTAIFLFVTGSAFMMIAYRNREEGLTDANLILMILGGVMLWICILVVLKTANRAAELDVLNRPRIEVLSAEELV